MPDDEMEMFSALVSGYEAGIYTRSEVIWKTVDLLPDAEDLARVWIELEPWVRDGVRATLARLEPGSVVMVWHAERSNDEILRRGLALKARMIAAQLL